jgi:divalent metal cation (Fe/Co/Zn/Cd) transporter
MSVSVDTFTTVSEVHYLTDLVKKAVLGKYPRIKDVMCHVCVHQPGQVAKVDFDNLRIDEHVHDLDEVHHDHRLAPPMVQQFVIGALESWTPPPELHVSIEEITHVATHYLSGGLHLEITLHLSDQATMADARTLTQEARQMLVSLASQRDMPRLTVDFHLEAEGTEHHPDEMSGER